MSSATKLHKTRFHDPSDDQSLLYGMLEPGCWRFFHKDGHSEPRPVGPQHPTKESLLNHLEDFGREYGFDVCFNKLYLISCNDRPRESWGHNRTDDYDAIVVCARDETHAREIGEGRGIAGDITVKRLGAADKDTEYGLVLGAWSSTG